MNRQRSIAISLAALTLSACAQSGTYASATTRLDATPLGFHSASLQSGNVNEQATALDAQASRNVRASTVRGAAVGAATGCRVRNGSSHGFANCLDSTTAGHNGIGKQDIAHGAISARSTISLL